jgi:hypothetical protein
MLAKIKRLLIKPSCYESCKDVVFSAFVKAIVHQDLSGLIKSGSPLPSQLASAWDKVFNEYLIISGDTQISTLLALLKDIAIITNKLTLIELIVNQLAVKHHVGLADQLRSLGFRFQYADGPELMRELELTITQSKQHLLILEQNKAELQELQKNEGKPATEQDYQLQLSALEEFKGVAINEDTYTVARYCADIKRMRERYKTNAA